jgi:hypothetical protein
MDKVHKTIDSECHNPTAYYKKKTCNTCMLQYLLVG